MAFTVVTPRDGALLEAFYENVYLPAFAHQREPLAAWRAALAGDAPYAISIVLAHPGDRPDPIAGGIVFERYPASDCALLTYLVVAPAARRRGLGGALLDVARREVAGAALVLGEVTDPRRTGAPGDWDRLHRLQRWGARVLDVAYVQPDLGAGRDRSLALVAFTDQPAIDGARLAAFLREFYGVVEGALDDELRAIVDAVPPRVAARRLAS